MRDTQQVFTRSLEVNTGVLWPQHPPEEIGSRGSLGAARNVALLVLILFLIMMDPWLLTYEKINL